jgi:hypothetical protein
MSFSKFAHGRVALGVTVAALGASGAAIAATGSQGAPTRASTVATTGTWEVYTAPYACGEFGKTVAADVPEGPYAPGFYQTTINVHYTALPPQLDPNNQPVITFFKKAVLDYAAGSTNTPVQETQFEAPNPYSTPIQAELPPDDGMLIDCQDIRQVLLKNLPAGTAAPPAPQFIEGDVVIMVPPQVSSTTGAAVPPLTITAAHTANSFNCVLGAAACHAATLARTGIADTVENIQPVPVANP